MYSTFNIVLTILSNYNFQLKIEIPMHCIDCAAQQILCNLFCFLSIFVFLVDDVVYQLFCHPFNNNGHQNFKKIAKKLGGGTFLNW